MLLTDDRVPVNNTQDYLNTANLNPPGFGKSVFNGMAAGFAAPFAAANDIVDTFSNVPREPHGAQFLLNVVNQQQQSPGSSGVGFFIGNVAGFALNPINLAMGEVGGEAGTMMGEGAAALLPESAKSAAIMSGKWGGMFSGAMLPQDIAENYNQNTNHINWAGVATDAGINYGIGMALPAIPFAYGLVKAKLADQAMIKTAKQAAASGLSNGDISQAEHDFYAAYHDKESPEVLEQMARDILVDHNVEIDASTGNVHVPVATPDDIDNLHTVVPDQLATETSSDLKTALSDFIMHTRLDDVTDDMNLKNGMQGFIDHTDAKLEMKNEMLAKADKIVDDHLYKKLKVDEPLSQEEIYSLVKNDKAGSLTIPENVTKRISQDRAIKVAKIEIKQTEKQISDNPKAPNLEMLRASIATREKLITDINEKLEPLLKPKEELAYLREQLTGEKLKPDFALGVPFNRLLDLTDVWHNAKILNARVQLEHQYNKQEAFRQLAKNLVDISSAQLGKLAETNPVTDYLKNRIESKIFKVAETKTPQVTTVPKEGEQDLKSQVDSEVKESAATELKSETEDAVRKYDMFKNNLSRFDDYIKCVGGK